MNNVCLTIHRRRVERPVAETRLAVASPAIPRRLQARAAEAGAGRTGKTRRQRRRAQYGSAPGRQLDLFHVEIRAVPVARPGSEGRWKVVGRSLEGRWPDTSPAAGF